MKNILENLADSVREIALVGVLAAASVCIVPSALSQGVPPSGTFSVISIPLPYATLAPGLAGSGGTSTNLSAGWSSIASNVLTSTTWNSTSNAFVTVTNTIFTTNTIFADMPVQSQKDLMVSIGFNGSGVTNRTLTFARLLDSGTVENVNTTNVTIAAIAGSTNTVANINFPASWLGGAGGLRLVNDLWTSTNAMTMTNNFLKYAVKRNAF